MSHETTSHSKMLKRDPIGRWLDDKPELPDRLLVSAAELPTQAGSSGSANNLSRGSSPTKQTNQTSNDSTARIYLGSCRSADGAGAGCPHGVQESKHAEPYHRSPSTQDPTAEGSPTPNHFQVHSQYLSVSSKKQEGIATSACGNATSHSDPVDSIGRGSLEEPVSESSRSKGQGGFIAFFTSLIGGSHRPRRTATKVGNCPDSTSFVRSGSPSSPAVPERIEKRSWGRRVTDMSDSAEEGRTETVKKLKRFDKSSAIAAAKTIGRRSEKDIKERYACPFYRHSPDENTYVSCCAGKGFSDIHRLKAHLKRYHAPIDKDSPSKASSRSPSAEHMTQYQFAQLGGNLSSLMCNKSRTEKWETVFRILFPDVLPIPHAYMEAKPPERVVTHDATLTITSPAPSRASLTGFENFIATRDSVYISSQMDYPDEQGASGLSSEERSRFAARVRQVVASLIRDYRNVADADSVPSDRGESSQAVLGSDMHSHKTPSASLSGVVVSSESEAPQRMPMAPTTTPFATNPVMRHCHGASYTPIVEGHQHETSPSTFQWMNPVTGQYGHASNNRLASLLSPGIVDPRALSFSESDLAHESQVFSSQLPSHMEQHTGSFTSAPPKEADGQAAKAVDRVSNDPNALDNPDFSYTFDPEQDVDSMYQDPSGAARQPFGVSGHDQVGERAWTWEDELYLEAFFE